MEQIVNHNKPKPFYSNLEGIKAFVLGCDPTGFDKNGNRLEFEFVFDLGKDKRYFAGILANLKHLGLSLDNIYVQNLVTDYQKVETGKNKEWQRIAEGFIPQRKNEFDNIDPTCTMPVFLTSYTLYKVLININQSIYVAKDLYSNKDLVPILPSANRLERPLIPLFRHHDYALDKQEEYKKTNKYHLK